MDATTSLSRLTLKSVLETPEEYKSMLLDRGFLVGADKQYKPQRVEVLPIADPGNLLSSTGSITRVIFYLPRYNWCNGLSLQVQIDTPITALGKTSANCSADLFNTGFLRGIPGSFVQRVSIKYGSYEQIIPMERITDFAFFSNSPDEFEQKKRRHGMQLGATVEGTNRAGGYFTMRLPSFLDSGVPIGALPGEISVEILFQTPAVLETGDVPGQFWTSNAYALTANNTTDGQTVLAAPANATDFKYLAHTGTNNVFDTAALTPTPTIANLSMKNPRIIADMVNLDEQVMSEIISRVKTSGIAIPYTDIQFADYNSQTLGSGLRLSLSQISGLLYALIVKIRRQDLLNVNTGSHSTVRTLAYDDNVVMQILNNNNYVYSNTGVPLQKAADELAARFKMVNYIDSNKKPVYTGFCFSTDGKGSLAGEKQLGYVDMTQSASAFLTLTPNGTASAEWNNPVQIQISGLAHQILIMNSNGLSRVTS